MNALRISLAALVFAAGCTEKTEGEPSTVGNTTQRAVFAPAKTEIANISGVAWDPEAFWWAVANCGMSCPIPPVTVPGVPLWDGATVTGASIALFDPVQNKPAFPEVPTQSDTNGSFEVRNVTSRADVPFFAMGLPPPADATLRPLPPFLPAVPAAPYLPTLTLKPILTKYTWCAGQNAVLMSTGGILDAVAKFLSQTTATTVGDLIDPTKFGGVAVIWQWQPGSPALRVPADQTRATASAGTRLFIDWAPPTAPLPPAVKAIQSPRGFFVNGGATASAIGVTVVYLPPGPPAPIQIGFEDTGTGAGRPWPFPQLPPLVVAPGIISFMEMQALTPGAPPPPEWICVR